MNIEERKTLAQKPIVWKGDLSDDCTAEWAGLMLRAEWMDEDYWWWAVYDIQRDELTIDDSNEYTERFIGGDAARKKAEAIALNYIDNITYSTNAKYLIEDTFKFVGRGILLAGYITEGTVSPGDTVEFTAYETLRQRKIIGVEGITMSQPNKINTGLLIKCNSDEEIEKLKNWKPDKIVATIYRTRGV